MNFLKMITMEFNIFDEKIVHEKMRYVCRRMKLHVIRRLYDKIGTYAYVLRDDSERKYLFACKRYIDWSPKSWGRVSFTKSLVEMALRNNYMLIMLIEQKDNAGDERNYIYTYNPHQIIEHSDTYDNIFNGQLMVNFNIELAFNMELTRRREILETRVQFKEKTNEKQKDKMLVAITRFV